jgi:hypothetical protein
MILKKSFPFGIPKPEGNTFLEWMPDAPLPGKGTGREDKIAEKRKFCPAFARNVMKIPRFRNFFQKNYGNSM